MAKAEHIKWFAQELATLISENPNDTLMNPVRKIIEEMLSTEFYKGTRAEPPEWITVNRD